MVAKRGKVIQAAGVGFQKTKYEIYRTATNTWVSHRAVRLMIKMHEGQPQPNTSIIDKTMMMPMMLRLEYSSKCTEVSIFHSWNIFAS